MGREIISQGGFVWNPDIQGDTDTPLSIRRVIRREPPPNLARQRLRRQTGERAIGGVPTNINPEPFKAFLDRQTRNVQS